MAEKNFSMHICSQVTILQDLVAIKLGMLHQHHDLNLGTMAPTGHEFKKIKVFAYTF